MPAFINFTASPENRHVYNTGSPVHDGKIPRARREIQGIRIDGFCLKFLDSSIPDRLHRTLVEARTIQKRGAVFDCMVFAAIMHGVEIGQPNDGGLFPIGQGSIEEAVDPNDITVNVPLNLGRHTQRVTSGKQYVHTVSPAHLVSTPKYLHKLGDKGPVCLSGLREAMNVFNCTFAHPAVLEAE